MIQGQKGASVIMDVASSVRAWDVFAVAVGLGLVIMFQQIWFQMKLREKEREIQRLNTKVDELRESFEVWVKSPKEVGLT